MRRFQIDAKYKYCPNGNYWSDVSGLFDRKIYLFCDCNKCGGKIYELRPIDITKKISKEKIENLRKINELDEIKSKINLTNLDKVKEIIINNK